MKTAIYARVSTKDRQETENQLKQLRDFAAKQEWHITREYVDRASGKTGEREQLKTMLEAASRREFDVLLFWSLDRLTREGPLATLQCLQRLTAYGVRYRSFTEAYLDSCGAFGDAVVAILGYIARQERIRLSERVLAGLARARAQGRVGGRPLLTDNTKSKVLKLRKQGFSLAQIADQVKISRMSASRIVNQTSTTSA
jgi:DNA invertase Pin-like site-specific DNA recombinase